MTNQPDQPNTNDTTPTPDDPLLTAYALGELEPGSADHQRITAQLEADADARAFVEQTRAMSQQLTAGYHASQASPGLSDAQRQTINQTISQTTDQTTDASPKKHSTMKQAPANTNTPRPLRFPRPALIAAGLALAAGAAITTVTLLQKPDAPNVTAATPAPPVTGLARVSEALDQLVAVDFNNEKLDDIIAYLNKQTGITIETDWTALELRGLSADTRVTLKADKPRPARDVLSAVLHAAWAQTQHPDPAQWALTDTGVAIAPLSKIVQDRLDLTGDLLSNRRFSQAAYEPGLLKSAKADVWDTDLYKQIIAQRKVAADRVLAEAKANLDTAAQLSKNMQFADAAASSLYAYRVLAGQGHLLSPDQVREPLSRIGQLRQGAYLGQLYLDDPEVGLAVEQALNAGKTLEGYNAAMAKAKEALEKKDFNAAETAVLKAQAMLSINRDTQDPNAYQQRAYPALQLHQQIRYQRHTEGAEQLATAKKRIDELIASGPGQNLSKNKEIQGRIVNALNAQAQQDYRKARGEIEAGLAMAPDNPALLGLREAIQDSSLVTESTLLHRQRELNVANQSLLNLEASTPLGGTLDYDGGWDSLGGEKGQHFYATDGVASTALTERLGTLNGRLDGITDTLQPTKPSRKPGIMPATTPLPMASRYRSSGGQVGTDFYFQAGQNQGGSFALGAGLTGDAGKFGTVVLTDGKQQNFKSIRGVAPDGFVRGPGSSLAPNGRPLRELERSIEELEGEEFDYKDAKAQMRWNLASTVTNRPSAELSRKQVIVNAIKERTPVDAEGELTEEQLEGIEHLRAIQSRLATNEPIELERIEAVKKLGELEARFQQETWDAIQPDPQQDRDSYALVNDNPFYTPTDPGRSASTFSVDVDTAAYTLVRRQLEQENRLPVPGAVRIEELINYFDYDYEAPQVDGRALVDGVVTQASLEQYEKEHAGFAPFNTDIQVTDCPWNAENRLVRIAVKGMEVSQDERPNAHLTFLLDVSGSMSSANKLPLVKQSMRLLLDKLNEEDKISIVVYAGAAGLVMENVSASDRPKIDQALAALKSGGSTAGAAGIKLAYQTAQKHFIDGGVNRVILCTDGDFNVGTSGTADLVSLIKEKANPKAEDDGKKRGVYFSAMGFGSGNFNDEMMELTTNAGNGNYAYIDTLQEAERVMYDQAGSTLVTIAKDVKIQVHFDPTQVMSYRLIGYENRVLANEDFDNDKVDAGDIGAGHSVTALYEITLFEDDLLLDEDTIREVKLDSQKMDHALALNASLLQTAMLSPGQRDQLIGASKMLMQERTLAGAALAKLAGKPNAGANIVAPAPPADEDNAVGDPGVAPDNFDDGAMLAIRLRYKPVDAPAEDGTSRLITTRAFPDQTMRFDEADEATRFAAAVAGYGMILRSSPHAGDASLKWVIDTASAAKTHDPNQYRAKFIDLVKLTEPKMKGN